MEPQDKPKRRLVTYITEETYAQLEVIAKEKTRSISSIAEMQIVKSLNNIECEIDSAQTGTARHDPDPDMIKKSVIDVISTLPDENLQALADRLSVILARHGPAQTSTKKISPIHRKRSDSEVVKNLAIRLQNFMKVNNISQRGFREKYDVDVTPMTRWLNGTKGMSDDKIAKIESILSTAI